MRYTQFASFPTRGWAKLWSSNLDTIAQLQQQAKFQSSIFVAIDMEGKGTNIGEIGLTAISFINRQRPLEPPKTLNALYRDVKVLTFNIRVEGTHWDPKHREVPFNDDMPTESLSFENVEGRLLEILREIQSTFAGEGTGGAPVELTLTGWALAAEFHVLSRVFPEILQCFSSWVDLQELVNIAAGNKDPIAMCDCLVAFGVPNTKGFLRNKTRTGHRACNDTIRIIIVLLHVLAMSPDESLAMDQDPRDLQRGRNTVWCRRNLNWYASSQPPPDRFPFVARVTFENSARKRTLSCRALQTLFSNYNPVALGGAGDQSKMMPTLTGWVCLSGVDELDRFVSKVDRWRGSDGEQWEAVSLFDSDSTTLRTKEEARREARMKTKKDREENPAPDELDILAEGLELGLGLSENIRP
ncbi:hypothetical protein LIA77_11030 [Sarocladium implicatum]|nr:hypothetical protein LIA77_11030 [Sarocladium implicatum]